MNIRVIDPDGKVLAEGRDLESIRQGLKGRARKTFEALPTPEYERDQVRDWDFGDLPEQVTFTRNGITLKGYPALVVVADGSLALRLLDSPERAERAHRIGVRRLIALRAQDKLKHLKRNLPDMQSISLYFVGVGTQEELREDLTTAIVERAFIPEDALPRTRSQFDTCLAQGKARVLDVGNEICAMVRQTLAAYHEVRKMLHGDLPFSWLEAVADMQEQMDALVYRGFVSRTPYPWLQHLPRYLQAIEVRLQKLKAQPDRDRQRRGAIDGLWERYKTQAALNAERGVHDPELEGFRWMLEELRVSQFAQELKTAYPVSVKRLEERWERVKR
jgi:ATP-dependent helicase HrpA